MNGIELFTKLYNEEIDDNTYIVVKCEDHEYDTYYSKEEIELSDLLFKEYSFGLINKDEALKIEKVRELEKNKANLEKTLGLVNEDLASLNSN